MSPSQLSRFTSALEARTGLLFPDYRSLHDYSVREYRSFWRFFLESASDVLDFTGEIEPVCEGSDCEHARFFPNLQLNYARSLLNESVAPDHACAITAVRADGTRVRWTRGELRDRVMRLAQSLSQRGLKQGDRVVGVMRNDDSAVVAALAVTALGATLSTAAPEMGVEALVDRFAPLAPRFLFAHGKAQPSDAGVPLAQRMGQLASALPTVEAIVLADDATLGSEARQPTHRLEALIDEGDASRFTWQAFPFNHPLFIMFSSGTTGRPKCIVHGAGGTLIEHVKEHRLHTGLTPRDRMYFHTGCGWMMWNWQLSALASGVEIVTYDGPISSVDRLWRLVADERVTVFGTSPAYLAMCEDAQLAPGRELELGRLRAILSTGAVLYERQFEWVRERVKRVPLQSISGGTDIIGCFVLGNPDLPVRPGYAQCKSLGLDVQAWAQGAPAEGIGELVCANPFPSRPIGFYGDADGTAFHAAYFARNPGIWTHGDLVEFSWEGGARLHGRCDGVLNVRGIKVAPGEVYRVLADVPEVRESMLVEQRLRGEDGSASDERLEQRVVLLLVLQEGAALTAELVARVRRYLARRLSPAHVPDCVAAVAELPMTHNGKFSEAAARSAVNGCEAINVTALRNPGSLEAIRNHPALRVESSAASRAAQSGDTLEAKLRSLWEQRLAFAPIAPEDNFFELGGNSLLAARLLADVERLTGRVLPLATLLVAPTVRKMAALIEAGEKPPTGAAISIRPGAGAPVFIVHGLSGSVMDCWSLVRHLKTTRPVYGFHAVGLDGEQTPQARVEDIAATYIEQMRAVQPRGPYALIGYSFGGLVAIEMGRQLQRAGETMELVCLLDSYAVQDLPWNAWVRHRLERALRKLRELSLPQLLGYAFGKLTVAAGGVAVGVGIPVVRPQDALAGLSPVRRRIHESMNAAMEAYRPQPFNNGPILYLRAHVTLGEYFDPLPLWQRVAGGGIKTVEIPGGHLDMLGTSVQAVALALDRALAQQ
jgi:acetoacetyl-CoA synthetase